MVRVKVTLGNLPEELENLFREMVAHWLDLSGDDKVTVEFSETTDKPTDMQPRGSVKVEITYSAEPVSPLAVGELLTRLRMLPSVDPNQVSITQTPKTD